MKTFKKKAFKDVKLVPTYAVHTIAKEKGWSVNATKVKSATIGHEVEWLIIVAS